MGIIRQNLRPQNAVQDWIGFLSVQPFLVAKLFVGFDRNVLVTNKTARAKQDIPLYPSRDQIVSTAQSLSSKEAIFLIR